MSTKPIETVEVQDRLEWRKWLEEHHDAVSEIWLVFYKRHTGITPVRYDDAVEEAICFGWIGSAKRPETREKRLQEALELLAAGKKLGLK